eukprot:6178444-Pleurochrysis_carterae.AAC.2
MVLGDGRCFAEEARLVHAPRSGRRERDRRDDQDAGRAAVRAAAAQDQKGGRGSQGTWRGRVSRAYHARIVCCVSMHVTRWR